MLLNCNVPSFGEDTKAVEQPKIGSIFISNIKQELPLLNDTGYLSDLFKVIQHLDYARWLKSLGSIIQQVSHFRSIGQVNKLEIWFPPILTNYEYPRHTTPV